MNRLLIVIEFVEKMGSKGQNVNCKSKVKVNTQLLVG